MPFHLKIDPNVFRFFKVRKYSQTSKIKKVTKHFYRITPSLCIRLCNAYYTDFNKNNVIHCQLSSEYMLEYKDTESEFKAI